MLKVACAVILIEGKIVVTQRSESMKLPLKWEFPGGKLEPNETASDCVKREIREELNIEIEVLQKLTECIFNYGTFQINLIPFLAQHTKGEIILAEHNAYKLLNKKALFDLDWAAADLPIVNELQTLDL